MEDTAVPTAAMEATSEQPEEAPIPLPQGDEALSVLEALLFSTTEPLKMESLMMLTGGIPREELQGHLVELSARYEARNSGLMLLEAAGGYQLATKPTVADWVLQLHKHRKKNPITPALLETLAIVAYKQPVARSEVEAIRGVDCSGVLRALQDSDLVEVVGRREVAGRPAIYGTTQMFLKTFGLRSLDELPQSEDMARLFGAATAAPPDLFEDGPAGDSATSETGPPPTEP